MRRSWFATILLTALLAVSAPLSAQGRGKAKGNPHAKQAAGDRDRDEGRWERRGDFEYRVFGANQGMPPGWNKGKKTGWKNCGLPPGQAKKYGCRGYVYGGRQYFYYRDDAGQIIVRRPAIHVYGGVDVH